MSRYKFKKRKSLQLLIKILQFRKKYPTHRKDVVLQFEVQLKAIHEKEPIVQMYNCRFSSEV